MGSLSYVGLAPSEYLQSSLPRSSSMGSNPRSLSSAPSLHSPRWACNYLPGKHWLVLISVPNSLHLVSHAFVVLPSEVLNLPPFPADAGVSECAEAFACHGSLPDCKTHSIFFVSLFSYCLFPNTLCAVWFAFFELWGLLQVFSRCSVGDIPHADAFLMYFGEKWCSCLTSPSSTPPEPTIIIPLLFAPPCKWIWIHPTFIF